VPVKADNHAATQRAAIPPRPARDLRPFASEVDQNRCGPYPRAGRRLLLPRDVRNLLLQCFRDLMSERPGNPGRGAGQEEASGKIVRKSHDGSVNSEGSLYPSLSYFVEVPFDLPTDQVDLCAQLTWSLADSFNPGQYLAPLFGESVSLIAAAGFIRNGRRKEIGFD
jgi:hypothetical protein